MLGGRFEYFLKSIFAMFCRKRADFPRLQWKLITPIHKVLELGGIGEGGGVTPQTDYCIFCLFLLVKGVDQLPPIVQLENTILCFFSEGAALG